MKQSYPKTALPILLIMVVLTLGLAGCKNNEQTKYPEYNAVENAELGCIELEYEGVIYRPYGSFYNNDFRGNQIGIREGDLENKICEVIGYSSDEWITEYTDMFMGGGDMLFKAVGVIEIPAELERYKSYDY